jgi:hypothetical protein
MKPAIWKHATSIDIIPSAIMGVFWTGEADPLWLHQNGMWEYIRDEGEKHEADAEDMNKL